MATNKKISQFTGQASVLDGAFFTLVSATGTNIKISVADFLNSRTLSGALQQDGPTVSTPVLDIAGAQYKIRNLVAGKAVSLSIEAENGLQIDFSLGNTAEPNTTYQALVGDRYINCQGTFTTTLVDIADVEDEVTITSTSGTITLAADASIQSPTTVTTGNSVTLYKSRGQWYHK